MESEERLIMLVSGIATGLRCKLLLIRELTLVRSKVLTVTDSMSQAHQNKIKV